MSDLNVDAELSRREVLHELFEWQAELGPNNTALFFSGENLSYGQLEKKANQLARFLRLQGIGKGSIVGLLLPRSPDLYIALLAVLKAGAAYVPLDPESPEDRLTYILEDCAARGLVTLSTLAAEYKMVGGVVVELDREASEIQKQPERKLLSAETGVGWDDPCYIIYTSGSTGRPKGVIVEHRSVCNLVRAEARIFQVQPADRVYQGFSIAFDASVEEIWLAFFAGATLVIGSEKMQRAGPALSAMLTAAGVTVLSCVPTLLALLEEDVPTVRLLILGGEECPPQLIRRWCKPERRVFNTYGPTEATVIATYAECSPEKPVTIGRPMPNYYVVLLDSDLRPVPPGVTGGICIGGVGVARGYVRKPELTDEKFITIQIDSKPMRLYRSGDLGQWTSDGELQFMGRADSQVKLRGYRIELSEVESVLLEAPGVRAAVVAVREDVPSMQQLVAYVVCGDQAVEVNQLQLFLRRRLPGYMMPGIVEIVGALPTLPSGKVDRQNLPPPSVRSSQSRPSEIARRSALECRIAEVWESLLVRNQISTRDHFFLDLGGHSLLAARMVSELREDSQFRGLSMLDIYNHPTIESLAALVAQTSKSAVSQVSKPASGSNFRRSAGLEAGDTAGLETCATATASIPRARHALCGFSQAMGLYFVLGFFSLQWLAPYLTYTWIVEDDYSTLESILGALAILVGLYPLMLLASIVIKWTVIGRYKPGQYPLWGSYYFRWWFVNTIQSVIPIEYLTGTPLLNIYYRLMGARIGANVYLGTDNFAMYDLLEIGDDTSIGTDASLPGYTVGNGLLKIGDIQIGNRCFVGTRAVMRENTRMEDDSALEDLSMLPEGKTVPAGERWVGSPAKAVASVRSVGASERNKTLRRSDASTLQRSPPTRPSRARQIGFGVLHTIGLFLFPVLVLSAILPGMILMNYLNYQDDYYSYLVIAPIVALSFVVLLCTEIVVIKWLLLGKVRAGSYPLHSFYFLRKWFVDQTMELSLDVLGPLYASVYLAPWYRCLGAKVGRRAEISTASFISPDLLAIDDESFIADSVSLGAARVDGGTVTIGETRIGKRSFIGNSALLPPKTHIGDDCLIGCLSVPPAEPEEAARAGGAWFGSPSFFLPQRQESAGFAVEQTFRPSQKLRLQRGLIELVRVILPSTGFIILTSLLFSVVVLIQDEITLHQMLLLFPLLYAGCGVLAVLFVVAAKWILVGRYKPSEKPLWSTFVWRNELVNALHEHLADLFLVEMLTGTPFVCWYFRMLGAKIGPRVYMETTDLTEFDLVKVGREATLNADCTLQTHLFEDRVMKMSTIDIAPGCTVGSSALVLYDTTMQESSSLGDLSLLMKGETLPARTRWEGIPAQPVAAQAFIPEPSSADQ